MKPWAHGSQDARQRPQTLWYHPPPMKRLRTISIRMPHIKHVHLAMVLPVGGKDDPSDLAGLAHYTEHMVAGRGKHWNTCPGVDHHLTRFGAWFDAYVNRRCSVFRLSAPVEHSADARKWLMNCVFDLDFQDNEWEIERKILEHQVSDDYRGWKAEDDLLPMIFGPRWSRFRDFTGTDFTLAQTTPEDIRRFWSTHYRPESAVLLDISPGPHKWPANERILPVWPSRVKPAGPALRVFNRKWDEARLVLSYLLPNALLSEPTGRATASVIEQTLRCDLYHELRHKSGLVSDIDVDLETDPDRVTVSMEVLPDRAYTVFRQARLVCEDRRRLLPEEIRNAARSQRSSVTEAVRHPHWLVDSALERGAVNLVEEERCLEALEADPDAYSDEVQRVQRHLSRKNLYMIVKGPFGRAEREAFLQTLEWQIKRRAGGSYIIRFLHE